MSKLADSLPCIVCRKYLSNFPGSSENHPMKGSEFHTFGHYGSAITDHMDGTKYIVNICDACLASNVFMGRAKKVPPKSS